MNCKGETRRIVLALWALLLLPGLAATSDSAGVSPEDGLERLMEGNIHFAAGKVEHPRAGKLKISAGVYDLDSGKVRMLDLDMEVEAREEKRARREALRRKAAAWKSGDRDGRDTERLIESLLEEFSADS